MRKEKYHSPRDSRSLGRVPVQSSILLPCEHHVQTAWLRGLRIKRTRWLVSFADYELSLQGKDSWQKKRSGRRREPGVKGGREKATLFSYLIANVPISCPTQATARLCVCSTCQVSHWSKIDKNQMWAKLHCPYILNVNTVPCFSVNYFYMRSRRFNNKYPNRPLQPLTCYRNSRDKIEHPDFALLILSFLRCEKDEF